MNDQTTVNIPDLLNKLANASTNLAVLLNETRLVINALAQRLSQVDPPKSAEPAPKAKRK